MMDGLAAWLRQIIAVVLLAGLVDLMLPNRALQRYVRLVAGLLILLTVATPLLQFLKGDFSGRLAEDWGLSAAPPVQAASPALDLRRIEAEGQRWRQQREEDAANFAARRIEEAIRRDVEQTEGRKVDQVTVLLGRDQAGNAAVKNVTVLLAGQTDEAVNASPRPIAHVEAIAPVIIDLQTVQREEAGEGTVAGGGTQTVAQTGAQDSAGASTGTGAGDSTVISGGTASEALEWPDGGTNELVRLADPRTRHRIASLIAAKYEVPANGITVLETAGQEYGGG